MPDGNYDDVPLLKKLGVKEGLRLLALGFEDLEFLQGRECATTTRDEIFDLIFLKCETLADLDLEPLLAHLAPLGAIWTITPKGPKGINGVEVIMRGRAAGLNDAKVCSFSETHTGRKFVRWRNPTGNLAACR